MSVGWGTCVLPGTPTNHRFRELRPCDICEKPTGQEATDIGNGRIRCALCVRFPNRKKTTTKG